MGGSGGYSLANFGGMLSPQGGLGRLRLLHVFTTGVGWSFGFFFPLICCVSTSDALIPPALPRVALSPLGSGAQYPGMQQGGTTGLPSQMYASLQQAGGPQQLPSLYYLPSAGGNADQVAINGRGSGGGHMQPQGMGSGGNGLSASAVSAYAGMLNAGMLMAPGGSGDGSYMQGRGNGNSRQTVQAIGIDGLQAPPPPRRQQQQPQHQQHNAFMQQQALHQQQQALHQQQQALIHQQYMEGGGGGGGTGFGLPLPSSVGGLPGYDGSASVSSQLALAMEQLRMRESAGPAGGGRGEYIL